MERVDPFHSDSCPAWFTPVVAEVSSATITEAASRLDVWRQQVENLSSAHRDQHADLMLYLRELAYRVYCEKAETAGSLFLTYCCSPFLFEDGDNYPLFAYDIARQGAIAVANLGLPEAPMIRAELSRILQAFLTKFPQYISTWLITADCSFDGVAFELDGLLRVPFVDVSQKVTTGLVERLRELATRNEESGSKARLALAANQLATKHWKRIGPELLAQWTSDALRAQAWSTERIGLMPTFYEAARRDKGWFDTAVSVLSQTLKEQYASERVIEAWAQCVLGFLGRGIDPGRALVSALAGASASKRPTLYRVLLDQAWNVVGAKDMGLRLALLWHEKGLWSALPKEGDQAEKRRAWVEQRTSSHPHQKIVRWLVDKLEELQNAARSRLRPHEMAALRSELVECLGRNSALRRAAAEFLLWCADGPAADDAEHVVISLLTTPQDKAHLRWLQGHSARTVQIRARAVLLLMEGSGDIPTGDSVRSLSRAAALINNPSGNVIQPQTWINDHRVEQTLFGAVAKAERKFCEEYTDEWATEEERLVTWLFSHMKQEFSRAEQVLQTMAVHGLGAPIHLGLRFREVPKSEEGQQGSPTAAHDVDIAIIVRVVERGFVTTTRATLVQAKKLEKTAPNGTWKSSFSINPGQRDRLIDLSASSFYLFLVPSFQREECWVVPARFVRSMMLEGGRSTVLPWASAARAHRSLAQWLTYEVIGLWTGDERQDVIQRAEGHHEGRKPRFLVEITISRDDGEPRGNR